ncbi:MopE-related protein, partial [Nanoarchaeota archaeon]
MDQRGLSIIILVTMLSSSIVYGVSSPTNYVQQGWNLFSFPANQSFTWLDTNVSNGSTTKNISEAASAGWIQSSIYYFDQQSQIYNFTPTDDSNIQAFRGYWLYAFDDDLTLNFPISACQLINESCDGLDNDCDGEIDEELNSTGPLCALTSGVCTGKRQKCGGGSGWLACDASSYPGSYEADESTCDGLDNDCDGNIDEGLTGSACPQQDGECVGSTEVCQGTAGWKTCGDLVFSQYSGDYEPTEVTCDDLDNDCDGATDEDLVGNLCASQDGVCEGSRALCTSGSWQACDYSVYSGDYNATETVCDGLDNDCDGNTDEGFVDAQGSGTYDTNTTCGNCYTDCTQIYGKDNAAGVCNNVSGNFTCQMDCDSGYYDLNQVPDDGCEFQLDTNAIYVSETDGSAVDNIGCGIGPSGINPYYPCASITYALGRTNSTRYKLLIANGLYSESITLVKGISLYGGYRPDTWERSVANTLTTIKGTSSLNDHKYTIFAENITNSTVVEGFEIQGQTNYAAGKNSYAIYLKNAPNLTIS